MTAMDAPSASLTRKLPFYMRDNYAPVTEEVEATNLDVVGALPPELSGRFFRIGANPLDRVPNHWFDGDGMVHGIRLRDGQAEWYRNRWVQTKQLAGEQRFDGATGEFDLTVGRANTHIVRHAGTIMALEEGSFPMAMSPELETLGSHDFDGAVTTPVTAHPHVCAETGEMHFFGYELLKPPYITYYVADAAGQVIHTQPIDVPGPTMVHDFALSRHHAIFLDLPVVFDVDMALRGGMPFGWDPGYGARIGILDRDAARVGAQPRWFDVDPCYIFHIMNAWEDDLDDSGRGSTVVLDAGRHPSMWSGDANAFEPCYLWRWRFDLDTGTVTEEQLDDREHGFPRIDDRRTGLTNRHGWTVSGREGEAPTNTQGNGVLKYDLADGSTTFHDFGAGVSTSEPVFVPADTGAGEDEGRIMSYVWDRATDSSSFVVLDASDMSAAPIASVSLPQRVPNGFHGSWFADE